MEVEFISQSAKPPQSGETTYAADLDMDVAVCSSICF